MADADFEARLGRWFSETPALADADAFARRIEGRLDRGWALRRVMIGAAGVVGGVFATVQMLGATLVDEVVGASGASMAALSEGVQAMGNLRLLGLLPVGGEVMWMGAGLAILAIVLVATRALEEI